MLNDGEERFVRIGHQRVQQICDFADAAAHRARGVNEFADPKDPGLRYLPPTRLDGHRSYSSSWTHLGISHKVMHSLLWLTMLPNVSTPTASGADPALTATAQLEELPPGLKSRSTHAVCVSPPLGDHPSETPPGVPIVGNCTVPFADYCPFMTSTSLMGRLTDHTSLHQLIHNRGVLGDGGALCAISKHARKLVRLRTQGQSLPSGL